MKKRNKKTTEMLMNNVQWIEISDYLNISPQSLLIWRNGDSKERHEAIDLAVKSIIKERKMQAQ